MGHTLGFCTLCWNFQVGEHPQSQLCCAALPHDSHMQVKTAAKAKDWCPEHACAESTCVLCDPKAKATLDALRPTDKPKDTK